jgi:Domain of unknown function (DUF4410)
MRVFSCVSLVLAIVSCPSASWAQEDTKPAAAIAAEQQTADGPAKSKVVYVSDFELDAVSGKEQKSPPAVSTAPAAPADAKKEDSPAEQAKKLVDFMSITLVKELEKAGYAARRLRPGEARPEEGVGIHGVFAEPDEQNRLRRAVVGDTASVGKMELFVGVSNLARPEQALYALADPKGENKPGAVITVTSYAPVAKFEMEKNATEKTVKDTASTIVADLTLLLNANIAAVAH